MGSQFEQHCCRWSLSEGTTFLLLNLLLLSLRASLPHFKAPQHICNTFPCICTEGGHSPPQQLQLFSPCAPQPREEPSFPCWCRVSLLQSLLMRVTAASLLRGAPVKHGVQRLTWSPSRSCSLLTPSSKEPLLEATALQTSYVSALLLEFHF